MSCAAQCAEVEMDYEVEIAEIVAVVLRFGGVMLVLSSPFINQWPLGGQIAITQSVLAIALGLITFGIGECVALLVRLVRRSK